MPIQAIRLIRKMRGGAQAHLMECDDGHFYVVKFRNNPQHRRILMNEWIASVFLNYLQISTPPTAIVQPLRRISGNQSRCPHPARRAPSGRRTRLAFRIALSRRPRQNDGLRFHSRHAAGQSGELERIPGRAGIRQMDRKRRRPPVHFLPRAAAGMVAGFRRTCAHTPVLSRT